MSGPNVNEYNSAIPRGNDFLAVSQGNFLVNFQQLYNAFLMNHAALDSSTLTPGNHTVIELLSSETPFNTDAGELSFYSKSVEGQTDQLFMRYQGNTQEVQITNYQIYGLPQSSTAVQFFSVLPGKIMIYMGTFTVPGYPFILKLLPPVAKNIIAINFCPGSNPSFPPLVYPITSNNGIITQLELVTPFLLPITNEIIRYFIMVNI